MNKKQLDDLTVRKQKSESKIVSIRVPLKLVKKLEAKDLDVPKTVKNILERLAE